MTALLALALAATLDVPAGASLAGALSRARRGDVITLGPGVHHGSLGRVAAVSLRGAGEGVTFVVAPEGEPGVVVTGSVALEDLTLRAGPKQCALVVEDGGEARLRGVALAGGGCGARIVAGSLTGDGVDLRGERHALLVEGGRATLSGGTLRGGVAGVAVRRGTASLSHAVVFGPSREAAVAVTGGEAALDDVAVATPGPIGLAVAGGRLVGQAVVVRGAAAQGAGGTAACVEALGGELALASGELARCGGPGVIASGTRLRLDGVDVSAGSSDCVALLDGARAELQGVRCETRGAGLVASEGATARLRLDTWNADPVFVIDCASGARATLVYGEAVREPCTSANPAPGR